MVNGKNCGNTGEHGKGRGESRNSEKDAHLLHEESMCFAPQKRPTVCGDAVIER